MTSRPPAYHPAAEVTIESVPQCLLQRELLQQVAGIRGSGQTDEESFKMIRQAHELMELIEKYVSK